MPRVSRHTKQTNRTKRPGQPWKVETVEESKLTTEELKAPTTELGKAQPAKKDKSK